MSRPPSMAPAPSMPSVNMSSSSPGWWIICAPCSATPPSTTAPPPEPPWTEPTQSRTPDTTSNSPAANPPTPTPAAHNHHRTPPSPPLGSGNNRRYRWLVGPHKPLSDKRTSGYQATPAPRPQRTPPGTVPPAQPANDRDGGHWRRRAISRPPTPAGGRVERPAPRRYRTR